MDDAVGTVVERAGAVECAANEDARERADASVAVAVVTAVRGCPSPHSAAASALVSGLLTADAERVRRKARWVDAWRTAVGCALASLAAPPTLRVARAASGRPYVAHADGVACAARDVSIAHHGDWVLVAALTDAAGWRVGVDVVSVRDAPETSAELARVAAFLGTSEAAGVARAPDAEAARRAFCVAWAAKEAFVKATGEGITAAFASRDVGGDFVEAAARAVAAGEVFERHGRAAGYHGGEGGKGGSAYDVADASLFVWAVDADHVACVAQLPPHSDVHCPCGAFADRGYAAGAEVPQAPVIRVIDWHHLLGPPVESWAAPCAR